MSVTRPTLMGLPCASVVVVPPPAPDVLLLLLPPPQPAARAERPTAAIATAAHRQRCLLNEPSLARVSGSVPADPKPLSVASLSLTPGAPRAARPPARVPAGC